MKLLRTQVVIGQMALAGLIFHNAGPTVGFLVVLVLMVINGLGMFVDLHQKNEFSFLSDREQEALAKLAKDQDLSPERVMVQALRTYQMIQSGHAKLVEPSPSPSTEYDYGFTPTGTYAEWPKRV
jgi:hypothetical protein